MTRFEPKQFGKYYLLEKLAVGGMAEIYKAKTFGVDGFEKQLALKRILPHCSADKDFITMLIDEAKLSVLLSHANIVQVYDLGKVGDDYFISMEFIHGPNLRDIIYRCREKKVVLPPELAVYIISEACKGLDYAHRKADQSNKPLNIVHRDVSPQNILISYEGEVKIADFGIAKAAMNISHTMAGILKGKIAYMSPEQALGKTIDHRTDIFSAGIVLHETLTQEKLYTGESQFEVLKKIRTTRIDSESLPETLPNQLKNVLAKALAYYPKDRYQSAGEMQTDLTKFLYQTYIDFTPQKLAAFVKEIFSDELKRQQTSAAKEGAVSAQTTSMNVAQEALQENIVHRDDTGVTMKAPGEESITDTSAEALAVKSEVTRIRRKRRNRRVLGVAVLFAMLAGGGFSYWKWLHPKLFGKPESTTGTISINSDPAGANIFLDGIDIKLSTPAIIEDLILNKFYSLRLKKEGFADLRESIISRTAEPMSMSFALSKEMGTLNIKSEPDAANILIDKEDSGKLTPATISGLELKKEITITISKQDYRIFEKVLTLEDMAPVDIDAKLENIPYGNIEVSSTPGGASVYLDDKDTGKTTPATLEKLEQNKQYKISVKKRGFTGFTRNVTLTKESFTVSGNLVEEKPEPVVKPKPVAKPEPVAPEPRIEPKPEPRTEPKPEPIAEPKHEPEPEPALTGGTGTIKLSSKPSGADVFINAEQKGKTPFSGQVPSGLVSVLVNKDNYIRKSMKVSVAPGETKNLGTITLGKLLGEVYIATTPPGARVVFDGQDIGARTNVTVKKVRRDQNHSIRVSLPGYKEWSRSFSMGDDEMKSFNITLENE